jgi:hypothetical protein
MLKHISDIIANKMLKEMSNDLIPVKRVAKAQKYTQELKEKQERKHQGINLIHEITCAVSNHSMGSNG